MNRFSWQAGAAARRLRTTATWLLLATLGSAALGACATSAAPEGGPAFSATEATGGTRGVGGDNPFTGAYRFKESGPLAEPASTAVAFRLATVNDALLSRLARAFGIVGTVTHEAGQLSISDGHRRISGKGSAWAVTALGTPLTEQTATGGCLPINEASPASCATAAPPATKPVQDPGIQDKAKRVLLAAGLDVREAVAESTLAGPGWTVVLRRTASGLPVVGGDFVVAAGSSGLLVGHGFTTEAVALAPNRLLGVATGIRQLNEGLFLGEVPPDTGGPPTVLEITGVTLSLALVPSVPAQLLPAYTFSLADGTERTTPAVPIA